MHALSSRTRCLDRSKWRHAHAG